jgi:trigger factor
MESGHTIYSAFPGHGAFACVALAKRGKPGRISTLGRKALRRPFAGVAELVDALDLGSSGESRGGSSPSARTSERVGTKREPARANERKVAAMQVTETLSEGLKREYKVVVPASELEAKVNQRLDELKTRVRINGFRPGKVPVAHLKRMYGRATMAEVIESTVRDTNSQIVSERGFKLAADPKVTLPEDKEAVEQLIEGKSDLNYTMALEIVPPIALGNFKDIKIEKPVADVAADEVGKAIERIADQNKPFSQRGEGEKAASGDRVVISYVGRINGEPFEGGKGDDAPVLIGSNTFIPSFEDQIIGIAPGETRTIKVTFPQHYPAENLAGKDAEFTVTAKTVETPGNVEVNDEFAKTLGL